MPYAGSIEHREDIMSEPITEVVFRVWPKSEGGDVIALFPYDHAHDYYCTGYQHIGQHGAADFHGVVSRTRLAKPAEYVALKSELESIGYCLKIIKRVNHERQMAAFGKR
jgi:hypothetical protein